MKVMLQATSQEIQKYLKRPIKCLESVNNKSKKLKSYNVYYPTVEESSYGSNQLNVKSGKTCFQLSSALPVISGADFSVYLIPQEDDWLLSDLGMCHFY